jgi:branched-subunit amino acid aminotransferase/4-amino-4-deoxychorismate lyase
MRNLLARYRSMEKKELKYRNTSHISQKAGEIDVISPWYFKDRFIEPGELVFSWSHPLLQWGWGAFTTGKMENGLFEAAIHHIHRLISHAQRLLLHPPSYEKVLDTLFIWLEKIQQDNIQTSSPLKIKLSIIPPGDLVFSAYSLNATKADAALSLMHSSEATLHPKRGDLGHIKSHAYIDYLLIKMEAENNGFHDALLCDESGMITETTTGSFWFIHDDTLFFPDAKSGYILDSITRMLLTNAVRTGIETKWRGCLASIPSTARCYISNCILGVTQVRSIGLRSFPTDRLEHSQLQQILSSELASTGVGPCR